jgi:hypothetical protein
MSKKGLGEFLTQDEFNSKKAEALNLDPIAQTVRLSEVVIPEDAIKKEYIVVRGTEIPASKNFFREFANVLQIGKRMENELADTKKGGGDVLLSGILNAMKSVRQASKDQKPVTLYGGRNSHTLIGFAGGQSNRLSNAAMFRLAEDNINKYGLGVRDVITDPDGKLSIQMLHPAELGFPHVGQDELFYGGVEFRNSMRMSHLDQFMMRLVCTNGNIGMDNINNFLLKGLDSRSLFDFTYNLATFAANNFLPAAFEDNLKKSATTMASLREVETAYNLVKRFIKADDEAVRANHELALRDSYFQGIAPVYNKLKSKGMQPTDLSVDQKKMIRTGMSVWDLINSMTFIASHDIAIPMDSDKRRISMHAGATFCKPSDQVNIELLTL